MRVVQWISVAVCCGLFHISPSLGATRYVNVSNATPAAPYTNWGIAATNIQMAIDEAASGDEILVAPGVYRLTSEVNIPDPKALTLRSTQSRAAILDAQGISRGLTIRGTNSVVEGFTVRNGVSVGSAGGIYVATACTLRDCLVTSNRAWGAGGIEIYANGAIVENCTIQSNLATYYGGGVVFYNASASLLQNSIVSDNIASNYGGGVYFQGAGTVSNCWISGNRAEIDYAGGLYLDQGGELINSVVVGNYAKKNGGGVYSVGTTARVVRVVNCTIVSNTADDAAEGGGGIYAISTNLLVNDILYYNTAPTNANLYNHNLGSTVSNCCLTPDYGLPNITNAPAFVDAGAGDFRLKTASFCIDAGTTNGAPGSDIVGAPRPRTGLPGGLSRTDMGAYEYGFQFKAIRITATNAAQLLWDEQDRGIYRLDIATNAMVQPKNPTWQTAAAYTNTGMPAGQFTVHTQNLVSAGAVPSNGIFRLRISHTVAK